MPRPALPPAEVCEQARRSRDPRFDGLFFTGVHSTGIYCRPVCPAPLAGRVTYYASAAAAEAAGYRPCLRCRPELAPSDGSWRRGDAAIARALTLIDRGALAEAPLAALADRVGVGERQLRRLFVERLGAAPVAVHGTRRLLFAKQLLTETALPVTEVAMAAGFNSLRRFNAAFREAYRMAPRDLRREGGGAARAGGDTLVLRLGYRPPHDVDALLGFLRARALPGVEYVDDVAYARVVEGAPGAPPGWLRVSRWPGGEHALRLELHASLATRLLDVVQRLRRMFDLDADPAVIADALRADPRLRPLLARRPGLRLPGGWDGFETAMRAVLGQQVSVAAARTLATRLVDALGERAPDGLPHGLARRFPTPEAVAAADLADLGLTRARAAALRSVARAVAEGRVGFSAERGLDDFIARWTALPGIGDWTAHSLALRVLGHPDAFPAGDLVLRDALADGGPRPTPAAVAARAAAWRPWRAYAAVHLWTDAAPPPRTPAP